MLKRVIKDLDKRQKRNIYILLVLVIIGGFLELIGVSVFLPFIEVITNPEKVHTDAMLFNVFLLTGADNVNEFLIFMCILIIVVYIIKNIYMLVMYKLQYRYIYNLQDSKRKELMHLYLHQPYLSFITKNSASMTRSLVNDVAGYSNYMMAVLQLLSEVVICLFLVVYLIYQDFEMTVTVTAILFIFSFIYLLPVKIKQKRNGIIIQSNYENFVKWVNQAWGSIKEIKIFKRESYFKNAFGKASRDVAVARTKATYYAVCPRYVLESLIIVGVVLSVLLKLITGDDLTLMVTKLSVFVIAAFRLLPSVNKINSYVSEISLNKSQADAVIYEIESMKQIVNSYDDKRKVIDNEIEANSDAIDFKHVTFEYPNSEQHILDDVSLSIPLGSSIGIVGPTGSGKTTFVDILLGLIQPVEGKVLFKGKDIFSTKSNWENEVSYIPQNIYILDDSVRNNVAFGIDDKDINDDLVCEALKEAQLYEFVMSLPNKLDENVGERGTKLSGGQCQRIGIARALYRHSTVMVLDEATSALDNATEKEVMSAINSLYGKMTIISIAHRLSTLEKCDVIYRIEGGKIYKEKRL